MRVATVEKEWAEVRRKGRGKVEDWSWTVTFYEGEEKIDQHYINNEVDANMIAALFECGAYTVGEYGEVCFDTAFA
jgi:hypothetical protein